MTEFVLAYRCGAAPDSNRVPFSGRTVMSSHQRNIKILALEQGRQGETVDPQPCGYYSPKPPKCSIAHKPIGALPRLPLSPVSTNRHSCLRFEPFRILRDGSLLVSEGIAIFFGARVIPGSARLSDW